MIALRIADDEDMFKDDLKASDDNVNLSYLLGAAIVLDCYNFNEDFRDNKWT